MSNLIVALIIALILFAVYVLKSRIFQSNSPSLPPGPKGLPWVGNIFDMPSEKEWLTFAKWGETYGRLLAIHVKLLT
jgi:hypothetical protein